MAELSHGLEKYFSKCLHKNHENYQPVILPQFMALIELMEEIVPKASAVMHKKPEAHRPFKHGKFISRSDVTYLRKIDPKKSDGLHALGFLSNREKGNKHDDIAQKAMTKAQYF